MTQSVSPVRRRRAAVLAAALALAFTIHLPAGEQTNHVINGNAERADAQGLPADWSVHVRTGGATLTRSTDDKTEGDAAARVELSPEGANLDIRIGRPNLPPRDTDATYLFTADVKTEFHQAGLIAGYFCIGAGDRLHVGNFKHNAGWQRVEVKVAVAAGATIGRLEYSGGRKGAAVILIDNVSLTFLHDGFPAEVVQEQAAAPPPPKASPGIVVKADHPVRVTKVMPTDSRLVRAFAFGPVDGRTDTRYATGVVSEWSGPYGVPAVSYRAFNGNNGLHLTLPPGGFDFMLLRGDWEGRAYTDYDALLPPGDDTKPLCDIRPADGVFRRLLSQRLHAKKLTFFYTEADTKRTLNDIALLRVDRDAAMPAHPGDVVLHTAGAVTPDAPLAETLALRYGNAATWRALGAAGEAITLEPAAQMHLISPPQDVSRGLSAVTLVLNVDQLDADADIAVRVQDVLDPRREMMAADLHLSGPGRYTVSLDHPDQVFLPDQAQWPAPPRLDGQIIPPPRVVVSVKASGGMKLKSLTVTLHHMDRTEALAEAGAWRKFLLKGQFQSMSEPRPWMHLQDGTPIREQIATSKALERYRMSLTEVLETVEITRALLPDDDVVRQYHEWIYQNIDRRKPSPPPIMPDVPDAPYWAVAVREGWRHTSAIATWWLDHRMVDNGELGGGVGDDTDMYQTWQCLPMIESAPLGARLKDASARLTDVAMETMLEEGINKHPMDALHAYEEGINQLALNAWWFYGDPVHFERAMESASSVLKLLVETDDGRVHFGSNYMSIREARHGYEAIGNSPGTGNWAPARLMLHPLYVVGLYNRNPAVVDKFERWAQTWRDYQKPGAYVGQVDIATGTPTVLTPMPSADGHGPVDEWLALYHVTADPKWQEPFTFMMDSGGYWGTSVQYGRLPHALVDWPAKHQAIMTERIRGDGSGYAGFYLHKDRALLEQWLDESASWFGRYPYMDTAAEQKTDRVLTYKATVPLACYLGDAPNRNRWLNFTAVSYEGLRGEDFAALVWDAGPDRLKVAVYNFTDHALTGVMRTWRLDHGLYRVTTGADLDDDGHMDDAATSNDVILLRGSTIPLNLPAKQVTIIEASQLERREDIHARADLALSPGEITCDGDMVRGIVHNIGSAPADAVIAALDAEGKVIARQLVGRLEPPLDLKPRTVPFALHAPHCVRVVVDPDQQVAEIYEGNNVVTISAGNAAR